MLLLRDRIDGFSKYMGSAIFLGMRLIFDIETIGENFDALDATTQENLTRWIEKEAEGDDDYAARLEELKSGLGFSPLTGKIVALGVLDADKNKGVVYYSGPEKKDEIEDGEFSYKVSSEKEMLEHFWEGAKKYDEFVSFNGRTFDVPFLMVRSAIYKIKPSKNLLSNRYLSSQVFNAKHIDLLDQLTFYGAVRRKGNLHLWTRAFGIKSPKDEGVTGDDVAPLYKKGEYLDIARYNARDLMATKELYEYWDTYLRF